MRQRPRIESAIGKDFEVKPESLRHRQLTREGLWHFALSTGNLDPIYHNQSYAEGSVRGALVPPPTWYTELVEPNVGAQALYNAGRRDDVTYQGDAPDSAPAEDSGPPHHFLDGLRSFNASLSFRHRANPALGDTFTMTGRVARVDPKTSSRFGEFVIARSEIDIHTQDGTLVANGHGSSIVYDLESLASDSPVGNSLEEQDGQVLARPVTPPVDAMREVRRRGSTPRYGEDIVVGQAIDTLFKGSLDVAEISVFSVALGVSDEADREIRAAWELLESGDAVAAAARYRAIAINPAFGFGVERHVSDEAASSEGAPGAYDIGTQRVAWAAQAVTDWMGDAGVLVALDVDIRGFLVTGDDAWCKGKVTGVRSSEGGALVDLEIWVENQRGQRVSRGTSEVLLPTRGDGTLGD